MFVLSIYAVMNKQYARVIVFQYVLMLTKESAVYYVPIFLLILLMRKKTHEFFLLGLGYGLFLWKLHMLVNYALIHPGYTSMMSKSFHDVLDMIVHIMDEYGYYVIVLWSAFVLYLYRISGFMNGKVSKTEWGHYLLLFNIAGICTLVSFHNKYQPYYAFPWVVTCIIWISWELVRTTHVIQRAAIVLLSVIFIAMSVPYLTLLQMKRWNNDYAGDNALIELIEKTKTSRSYLLKQEYRPEYSVALRYLSESRKWPVNTPLRVAIFSSGDSQKLTESTPVCKKTFFGTMYCKWVVYEEKQ